MQTKPLAINTHPFMLLVVVKTQIAKLFISQLVFFSLHILREDHNFAKVTPVCKESQNMKAH